MIDKVKTFLKEVKQEMSAMTWPTQHNVWGSTIIVVGISILLGIFVGIVDRLMYTVIALLVK